jgi:hypothetical protein
VPIINLTQNERWKMEAAQHSKGVFRAYSATDKTLLDTLIAQGLVESTGPHQGVITELGTQALEFIASKKPEEDALWTTLLAAVETLPKGHRGNSRGTGLFTHHEDGTAVGRCRYNHGNQDGTNTNYDLTATRLPDGQITVQIDESPDDADWFWGPGGVRDGDDPHERVVVDHVHYLISPDTTNRGSQGHGGRRFEIKFFDGRTVITHNLWYQGPIPPKWHERFPNNAEFVPQAANISRYLPPTV